MARNGRPKKDIDWTEFEKLCHLQCSIREICEWFHITDKTLQRRCKEQYGETFSLVFEKKRIGGLISLRRNLFKQSEKGAAVAIFLAKNFLGMSDKYETESHVSITDTRDLTDEQLAVIAANDIIKNHSSASRNRIDKEAGSP